MYHYKKDGQKCGPVSIETLQSMADKGELKSTDLLWREGMTDWFPACQFGIKFKDIALARSRRKGHQKRVDCYFGYALLSMFFPITGFFALINSVMAYSKDQKGRTAEAVYYSEEAQRWIRISFMIGIPLLVIGTGLVVAMQLVRNRDRGGAATAQEKLEDPHAIVEKVEEAERNRQKDLYVPDTSLFVD